jgi:hypothetical protein
MTQIVISVTTECETCCGEKCSELECRTRGGTVELCGWDEFEGYVSTPPRFYLDKVLGGSIVICNYNSPSGKGPCEPDDCDSPIGATVSESFTGPTSCGDPAIQGNAIKATVTGAIPTPGTPGSVRITLSVDDTHIVDAVGTGLIYLNSVLVVSSISSGKSTVSRDYVSGTVVTMTPGVENACVSGGDRISTGPVVFEACIPLSDSVRYQYSGAATYFPVVDCDSIGLDTREIQTISEDLGCVPGTTGGSIIATSTAFDPEFAAYVAPSPLNSGSYKGQISSETCASDRRATACDRFEQLQNEDTEQDAIDRLLASPAGAWSAWQPTGDGTGGTCLVQVCCRSAWQIRTYRTFEYKEAEWRATVSGQEEGAEITFYIGVYRRAYGVGTYAPFQTLEYTRTVGESGSVQVTGVTPIDEGFETYVNCTFRAVEP